MNPKESPPSPQKSLEDALQAEKDLNRRYLEVASVIFVVLTQNQKIELINRKGCELLGYTQEELVGRNWFDTVIPAGERQKVKKVFDKLFAGAIEPVEYFENSVITSKGEKRLIAWTNNYMRDEQGRIVSIIGCGQDITEQRLAETRLIEEKNKLEALVAALSEGITVQDRDFKVIYQNRQHKHLQGSHSGELCYAAYQGRGDVCPGCQLIQTFKDGKVHSREVEARGKDGETIYMEVTASPVRDATGAIVAGIEAVRDISERKKLEIEAQRARNLESLGVFAGGIAHDFNNLLTAILGNLTLAKHRFIQGNDFEPMFEAMNEACERAQRLTRQLLTFAKGGAPVIDTASIRGIVINSTNFILTGSNTKVTSNFPGDIWDVEVDAGQISQVIQNLAKNADQATPTGGMIHIVAANCQVEEKSELPLKPGPYVHLTFTDSGSGMEEHVLEKIFDPYFTTKYEGSGLGLAISFSIIKKHKGHISAHSVPGRGATFELWLPAAAHSIDRSETSPSKEAIPQTGQGHILVMDDEKMIRNICIELLHGLGYTTESAWDGREMLEKYAKARKDGQPFDLVFIDLTIRGGMGGKEAIAKLLALDPEAKAVVASGYSQDQVMANYEEYGFIGVIPKPFTMQELGEVLGEVLDHKGDK